LGIDHDPRKGPGAGRPAACPAAGAATAQSATAESTAATAEPTAATAEPTAATAEPAAAELGCGKAGHPHCNRRGD
jgi:hypothetical protein